MMKTQHKANNTPTKTPSYDNFLSGPQALSLSLGSNAPLSSSPVATAVPSASPYPQALTLTASSSFYEPSNRRVLVRLRKYLDRRNTYLTMQEDMIVKAKVCNKSDNGIELLILEVYPTAPSDPKSREGLPILQDLESLDIRGECHISEIMVDDATRSSKDAVKNQSQTSAIPAQAKVPNQSQIATSAPGQSGLNQPEIEDSLYLIDRFAMGDVVKALVTAVDVHSEKIYLSLMNARLRGLGTQHHLGIVSFSMPGLAASQSPVHVPQSPYHPGSPYIHPSSPYTTPNWSVSSSSLGGATLYRTLNASSMVNIDSDAAGIPYPEKNPISGSTFERDRESGRTFVEQLQEKPFFKNPGL